MGKILKGRCDRWCFWSSAFTSQYEKLCYTLVLSTLIDV